LDGLKGRRLDGKIDGTIDGKIVGLMLGWIDRFLFGIFENSKDGSLYGSLAEVLMEI